MGFLLERILRVGWIELREESVGGGLDVAELLEGVLQFRSDEDRSDGEVVRRNIAVIDEGAVVDRLCGRYGPSWAGRKAVSGRARN